ncbi:MAG: hypothetical protein MJ247_01465 [Alphaproteobacteria bacterium]|nr:hypothetical protein [Alphaproteobacteria bacterium]
MVLKKEKKSESYKPLLSTVIKMNEYDFTTTLNDDLMLVFNNAISGIAKDPFISLDKSNAILIKSTEQPQFEIENLPEKLVNELKDRKSILVCEIDAHGEPEQIYKAPIFRSV